MPFFFLKQIMTSIYLAYALSGFFWGIYLKNFFFSGFCLYLFQVSIFFIFGQSSFSNSEFWVFLPLVFFLYCVLAIFLQYVSKTPRFISLETFCRELYIIKLVCQFIILHALLAFIIIDSPWDIILLLLAYIPAIIVIWFLNKRDHIWICNRKCNYASSFYISILFYLAIILLIRLITVLIDENIWPFWVLFFTWILEVIVMIFHYFI